MICFGCDWCARQFPRNEITTVLLSNIYNAPVQLHICRDCGRSHMPDPVQPMLSWTAGDAAP